MNIATWTAITSAQNAMRISAINASRRARDVSVVTVEDERIAIILLIISGAILGLILIALIIYFWRNK